MSKIITKVKNYIVGKNHLKCLWTTCG